MDTTTPSYEVDLEDERLEEVNDKWADISSEVTDNYQNMIDGVDEQYKDLQDAMDKSVEAQKNNQQALTDFTIEKIEQQKEQAHKDYIKEQSGAYKDWQKQSDRYGVNAEQMAASGMTNTGFSESSQVSMYNQYQNRVATAREVLSQAMLNYDNNIKEAMLQNNSILAEIEADAAIKAAELALEGFQYKNSLILEQTNKKIELENMRSQEWFKMLEQINTENALAEDVRQFNETQKFQAAENEKNRQHDFKIQELEQAHDLKIKELDQAFEVKMAEIEQNYKIAYLNAQTEAEKKLIQEQHDKDMLELAQKHENDKEILARQLDNDLKKLNAQFQNDKNLLAFKDRLDKDGGNGTIDKDGGNGTVDKDGGNGTIDGTVDEESVQNLGIGTLTEDQLAELVYSEKVIMTQVGDKLVFKWNKNVTSAEWEKEKHNNPWLARQEDAVRKAGYTGKIASKEDLERALLGINPGSVIGVGINSVVNRNTAIGSFSGANDAPTVSAAASNKFAYAQR